MRWASISATDLQAAVVVELGKIPQDTKMRIQLRPDPTYQGSMNSRELASLRSSLSNGARSLQNPKLNFSMMMTAAESLVWPVLAGQLGMGIEICDQDPGRFALFSHSGEFLAPVKRMWVCASECRITPLTDDQASAFLVRQK